MATERLIMLCGLPGSGKSTWAADAIAQFEEEHKTVSYCSRDAIRFSMLSNTDRYFAHEREVWRTYVDNINESLRTGIDIVICDATHISAASREKLLKRLEYDIDTNLEVIFFDLPPMECISRNAQREGRAKVPPQSIIQMAEMLEVPKIEEFTKYYFHSIQICIKGGGQD